MALYRTLCKVDVTTLVSRSQDSLLNDIIRLAVRDSRKHFACVPEEVELDPDEEIIWVFGEVNCEQTQHRVQRYRRLGVPCQRFII